MITGKDPMVGQALNLLVPDFDVDPDGMLRAAHAGAARVRETRRRRQTVAVVAFAALLLFAGAAFAAKKLDLLPFLHTNDRNSARFSVSPRRTYHGAAALALTCPSARAGTFVCHVSGTLAGGTRVYQLGMRTDKVPLLTRQSMLASLEHAKGVDPAEVARVRADLADVGDDFIRALAVLARIETVGGLSSINAGTERVPPRGVPAWAACREITLATYRCRPLAALVGVPSGAPLYYLQPSRDWRRVQAPPPDNPNGFDRELERLLGRKPTHAETRFFFDFATVAANSTGGPSGATKSTPTQIGSSSARSTALLAARSLGVRTRVVSAVAQPLPHEPLPGGLTRSDTRLYRVTFDLLHATRLDRAGRHSLFVYVNRSARLHVWRVVWVATKP